MLHQNIKCDIICLEVKEGCKVATTLPRVTITMDVELYEKVKDFQFNNRMSNQTTAINKLINLGLMSVGLMNEIKDDHTKKERQLIDKYNAAPEQTKKIIDYIFTVNTDDAEAKDIRRQIDEQTKKGPGA
jgi:hypothetical protein